MAKNNSLRHRSMLVLLSLFLVSIILLFAFPAVIVGIVTFIVVAWLILLLVGIIIVVAY